MSGEAKTPDKVKPDLEELRRLADGLRHHVQARGGPAKDKNGNYVGTVWPMMLDAGVAIDTLLDRIKELEAGLTACRTNYAGYTITKKDDYPLVVKNFWKELQRIDGRARALLEGE